MTCLFPLLGLRLYHITSDYTKVQRTLNNKCAAPSRIFFNSNLLVGVFFAQDLIPVSLSLVYFCCFTVAPLVSEDITSPF